MKKVILFAKRNLTEMIRDPLLYIFCVGFPIFMILMFNVILRYIPDGQSPIFYEKSLIPGIVMFSYSLLMLMSSLLISKDRQSAFLKRLFSSPLKAYQFILGYLIPFIIVGLCQNVICIVSGYISGLISGRGFVDFGNACLLFIEMLPMMVICISLGMIFGTILKDKSSPALSSIFICASGILGGAWMPLDTMGNFEKACGFLPFYESTYLGRCITGATHTPIDEATTLNPIIYNFSDRGTLYLVLMLAYMVVLVSLSLFVFTNKMKKDIS